MTTLPSLEGGISTPVAPLAPALVAAVRGPNGRQAAGVLIGQVLNQARNRAARKLEGGAHGVEVARLYSQAADEAILTLWRLATEIVHPVPKDPGSATERLALMAVGGYGRGVLAPYSDLDLLFLRQTKPTKRVEDITAFMLYGLWDMGFKVGHASRTVQECLKLAREDMTIRTSLLEARFLQGDEELADQMMAKFRRQVANAHPRTFIAAKLAERDLRHQKTGAVRYRVEPNIKDGKGGLRDLNALFWIARALAPESPLGARVMGDLLTPRERRLFEEAFDFLWRVRIHLHLLTGRSSETLTFDLQPEVAQRMGWKGRGDEPAVERFMRRYFIVARDVGALTRALSAKLEANHQKSTLGLSRLFPVRHKKLDVPGFVEVGGRLSVTGAEVFAEHPARLLMLFRTADNRNLDLHPDALTAVNRSLSLVTPSLRRDPEATRAFLDVLAGGQRPYRTLSLMNETGLLGRFLPEWGRIVGQTQFNMYHAYTVDEHTLQAIGIINDIWRGKLKAEHPMASDIVHRIGDFEVLMLAMLLHDVGKGGDRGQLEDGAIAARRACDRLGLDRRRTELVVWLVRHHLALSDFAQKRDVSDPHTTRAFADLVGDLERLRTLLVLTVADIRAVGPGVWNSWKGQLMRELFQQTEAVFRGDSPTGEAWNPVDLFPELVARARTHGAAADALTHWDRDHGETRLVVAATDRPGLFADIAAALALAGADVAGARAFTTDDRLAVDVFDLRDGTGAPFGQAEPRSLTRLIQTVETAVRDSVRSRPALTQPVGRRAVFDVRPTVVIMLDEHDAAAVIEVSAADRPGLLADVAAGLAEEGLSIRSAHVAAFGERVVDSFYVVDGKGRKPADATQLDALRHRLEVILDAAAEASPGAVRASLRDVSELGARRSVSSRRKAG